MRCKDFEGSRLAAEFVGSFACPEKPQTLLERCFRQITDSITVLPESWGSPAYVQQ